MRRPVQHFASAQMPEITLLGSVHKEYGRCSYAELVRILEQLAPEVLFQEVPYREFMQKDPVWAQSILEFRAISEHLKRHSVIQVPVDTLGASSNGEGDQFDQVIERVSRRSSEYRNLWDAAISHKHAGGFRYLNSRSNDGLIRKTDRIISKTLKELNDERLERVFAEWNKHNSRRDDVMISNIYEFSRRTDFKKGVFIFGSGHRASLIRKIRMARKTEPVKIVWKLANGPEMRSA